MPPLPSNLNPLKQFAEAVNSNTPFSAPPTPFSLREAASTTTVAVLAEAAAGLTGGRFVLCDGPHTLPDALPPAEGSAGRTLRLLPQRSLECLRAIRADAETVARRAGFGGDQVPDFMVAVGEAALNALLYGREATSRLCADPQAGRVQAWITDRGPGIAPRSLLHSLRGPTTESVRASHPAGVPGLWMMARLADCVSVATGPKGTTVVIEIDAV